MTGLNSTAQHTHPELANELVRMAEDRQSLPTSPAYQSTDVSVIFENADRLQEIVEAYGWPTRTQVGELALQYAGAILLETETDFQRAMIKHLRELPAEHSNPLLVALLEDRVCIRCKEPQIYGTHAIKVDGIWKLHPVIEPETLDERRKAVGLAPVAEFLRELNLGVN